MVEIKDLIGHKIIGISTIGDLTITTDKGIYEFTFDTYPDGSISDYGIRECYKNV